MTEPNSGAPSRAAIRHRPGSPEGIVLDGPPGRDGFHFYDGHNQCIHEAAPGLLGLLEARHVLDRWNPQVLRWLDDTPHFFNHLFAEFQGVDAFDAIRSEMEEIAGMDAALAAKNRFLFHYVRTTTRALERTALLGAGRRASERLPVTVTHGPVSMSLNGQWKVRYRRPSGGFVDDVMELPASWELVPGIQNYAGTMRFTKVLAIGAGLARRRLRLRFAGVDYFADLWVNGHYVGGHEGCFGPFEFDVTPFVRSGEPAIVRLAVTSPNDPAGSGTHVTSGWHDFSPASAFPNRKTLVKGTLGHHDARRGGAWSCLTSQDGNTGGVWNDVELRVVNPLHFALPGVRITTMSTSPVSRRGEVRIALQARLSIGNPSPAPAAAHVRMAFEPANFDGPSHKLVRDVVLEPGEREVVIDAELAPVRLWQPRDHGRPHLYRVTSTIEVSGEVQDRHSAETGFRLLAVSPIGESEGRNGAFVVNGRPLFVRGTNLLPTYWLSEYSAERVATDFELLENAGFNALVVHTLVLPKRFYEEANRRGMLVVQIFPLQWSYEQSGHLAGRATGQIREMAALLTNEPSVVSYEVHNEPDMRTAPDLDNRLMDFDFHAAVRTADPSRWATTFSSGNHAYPGQFYAFRDDNSFATLPARFLEDEVHGRRISRHRNMPTEFGIQGMPHVELFRKLVSEDRVKTVLERIRNDPKWLAAGAESWEAADKTIEDAKATLGDGSWEHALEALDWSKLQKFDGLEGRIREMEQRPSKPTQAEVRELLSCKVALLLLEVLHYGAFKGENFWFGLWPPVQTVDAFVAASQARQYRLHKDAIENYLNAGVCGPIVGYFSFMFRDADWQAPTWGVVDAAFVPKKAYRAYLESNQPVRVSLPHALRAPVKLPGDPLLSAPSEAAPHLRDPWVTADVIVANDTGQSIPGALVTVRLEDTTGAPLPLEALTFPMDLAPGTGWSGPWPDNRASDWVVPHDLPAGTYFLAAEVASGDGVPLSTNRYELLVLDTAVPGLTGMTKRDVRSLLDGVPRSAGFHYWQHGTVAHRARPGMRGLTLGFREAQARGVDLYETVQGEHLFRHVIEELASLPAAQWLSDEIWRIRTEVLSPWEKARVLVRYLEVVVERGEQRLAATTSTRRSAYVRPSARSVQWPAGHPPREAQTPVGSDIVKPHDTQQREDPR